MNVLHTQNYTQETIRQIEIIFLKSVSSGQYEQGLRSFDLYWDYQNPSNEFKNHQDLDELVYAELLLSCGSLFGHFKTSDIGSQEIAKDLLTNAFDIFLESKITVKSGECADNLAICYRRLGVPDEARVWLDTAYSLNTTNINLTLQTVITECLINFSEKEFEQTKSLLIKYESDFLDTENKYLLANFYNHRALMKRNLCIPNLVNDFRKAKKLFSELGHYKYEISVTNNLAYLCKSVGMYHEAGDYLNECLKHSENLSDARLTGSILDTLAQVYCDAERFAESLETSNKAIKLLENTEAYERYLEACQTKTITLFQSDLVEDALLFFSESFDYVKQRTSKSISDCLVKGFAGSIRNKKLEFFEELENSTKYRHFNFAIPEHISPENISVIEVKSSKFANLNIFSGHYMVIRQFDDPRDILERQPIVILDLDETNEVYVGFGEYDADQIKLYDSRFGLAYLSFRNYKVLGEVVGYYKGDNKFEEFREI